MTAQVVDLATGVVYERTGEVRQPKPGEDYLICPGVVGTAGYPDPAMWDREEEILRRVEPTPTTNALIEEGQDA